MIRLALISIVLLAAASAASAREVCGGAAPAAGASIHGPILDISDDNSLCIALGASPDTWIKVSVTRLAANRPQLMAAAFARNATCEIGKDGEADCVVEGQPLAQALHQPEIIKAATDWR